MDNETFESLLSDLVGDNVGSNCTCGSCEENRQTIREAVENLIESRTSELEIKVKKLTEENAELRKQLSI